MDQTTQRKIIGIGEVLFDVLPDGSKMLGGAPTNFAYVALQLGNHGIIASRVGNDADGGEIIERLRKVGVDVSHVQTDAERETGTVKVFLHKGQPEYEITENVAWDFLESSEDWQRLAKTCDAVCFGTLAQRNLLAKKTIQDFVSLTKADCLRIFDVNLRQNYFSADVLRDSLNLADVCKLNHEELPLIVEMFSLKGANEIEQLKNLRDEFDLKIVCLTRGTNGSLLVSEDETSEHPGIKIEIADTIGAGDAFTAALTDGLLRGLDLREINERANQTGAFVASKKGAMPEFTKSEPPAAAGG